MTRQRTRNTACRINLIPSVKYCRQLSCFQFLKPETHRCRLSPLSSFTARLLPTPSHSSQAINRSSSFFESQQRKLCILESPSFFFVSNYSLSLLLYCMYFSYFIRYDRSNANVKIHRRRWRTLLNFDGGNRRPIPSLNFDD